MFTNSVYYDISAIIMYHNVVYASTKQRELFLLRTFGNLMFSVVALPVSVLYSLFLVVLVEQAMMQVSH